MTEALATVIRPFEAMVNVTWSGQNGDLLDPVSLDASDADVKQMVTEALRGGSIPGINADVRADLTDFVVDRFPAGEAHPVARIFIRPKVPFGG